MKPTTWGQRSPQKPHSAPRTRGLCQWKSCQNRSVIEHMAIRFTSSILREEGWWWWEVGGGWHGMGYRYILEASRVGQAGGAKKSCCSFFWHLTSCERRIYISFRGSIEHTNGVSGLSQIYSIYRGKILALQWRNVCTDTVCLQYEAWWFIFYLVVSCVL